MNNPITICFLNPLFIIYSGVQPEAKLVKIILLACFFFQRDDGKSLFAAKFIRRKIKRQSAGGPVF